MRMIRHRSTAASSASASQRAAEAKDNASKTLADLLRQAYAQQEQQSAMLKAAHHVWSREYLRIVLGLNKKRGASKDET